MTSTDPIKSKWFLAVIAATIVLTGPMIAGYAVVDELALYVLLLVGFVKAWPDHFPHDQTKLGRTHRILFLVFCAYLVAETVRGGFVLHDPRMIRFAALFGALGLLTFFTPGDLPGPVQTARVVAWAGIIYMLAFIAAGIIAEWGVSDWRFDLQGNVWSGTTAAVFPLIIVAPAFISMAGQPEKSDRRLFWIGFVLLLFVGFYYQSRLTWLTVCVTILGGAITLGFRRVVIALMIWLSFIVFFPWTQVGLLTPSRFLSVVTEDIANISIAEIVSDVSHYRSSVIGSSSGLPPPLTDNERELADPRLEGEMQRQIAAAQAELLLAANDPVKAAALRKQLAAIEARRKQIEEIHAKIARRVAENRDVDRKLALLAAVHYWVHNGALSFLFGTGYYTHRYILPATLREISEEYGFEFPDRYRQIVRTAIFNGMLVDTGLLGMGLFAALFGLTALYIMKSAGLSGLFRPGPHLTAIGTLALMAISLNVGAIYDVAALYIALMPGGTLILLTSRGT